MSTLDEVYARARRGSNFFMHIPHSVVTLSCVAVRHNLGIEVSPSQMEGILYEEGLLPATEYKIPAWYRKKYLHNK